MRVICDKCDKKGLPKETKHVVSIPSDHDISFNSAEVRKMASDIIGKPSILSVFLKGIFQNCLSFKIFVCFGCQN